MDVLDGIRVVDLTMWAFMPSVGGVLAHWGADVVKVEGPRAPDPMRLLGGSLEPGEASWWFKHYSRGKRSVAIDLAVDEGREVLYRLVERADVFLTSYLPETRRKLRVDVEDIRSRNPRIIYVRGTGQGPLGPEAERGAGDGPTWWCRGSLAASTMAATGIDWPSEMVGHGDGMSGVALVGGVLAALLKRERTGVTSVVDGSLMGTAIWFNGPAIIESKQDAGPGAGPPPAPLDEGLRNRSTFRTLDGRYLFMAVRAGDDEEWRQLCRHLDRPDLLTDDRFATADARLANAVALRDLLTEVLAHQTLDHWRSALAPLRSIWAPVQTPREMHDDPQTLANGFIRDVAYPSGPLALPVPPVLFDEDAGDPLRAPDFAEHTDEVLREVGYAGDEVRRLRAAGVIG